MEKIFFFEERTGIPSRDYPVGLPWDLLCVSQCIKRELSMAGILPQDFLAVPSSYDKLQRTIGEALVGSSVSATRELEPFAISDRKESPCAMQTFRTDGAAPSERHLEIKLLGALQ